MNGECATRGKKRVAIKKVPYLSGWKVPPRAAYKKKVCKRRVNRVSNQKKGLRE